MPEGPYDPHSKKPTGKPASRDQNFDWLYGSPARGTVDETTRMLPTTPRPQTPIAPTARPSRPALPPEPSLPPFRPPSSTRVRWRRVLTLFVGLPLAAWVAFLLIVPIMSWNKFERVNAFPSGARPAAGEGTNYLLVGSDSRRGLSQAQMRKLGVGGVDIDSGRTDTIMIMHVGSGPSTLISVPRDSWVQVPGHGTDKINSAYTYGGAPLLIKTIEQNTGLRIDHFVAIGLGGFVKAVDAVGGVKICADQDLKDWRADLNIKKGCHNADGATALAWSRSRHAFELGDIARAEHQRTIVKEVGAKAKSIWTFVLPWRYLGINKAAVDGLTIDKSMSMWDMFRFAHAMSAPGKTCGMPIANLNVNWDRARATELLQYLKTDNTEKIPDKLCTPTGLVQ